MRSIVVGGGIARRRSGLLAEAGLSTEEMERHITTFSEFSTSFAVSNIKTIESQTTNGVSVIKIYFQPTVDIRTATAQVRCPGGAQNFIPGSTAQVLPLPAWSTGMQP